MSKYKAKKIEYKGIAFDSKKECSRYVELSIAEEAGQIRNLELQKRFELIPAQKMGGKTVERACHYVADFVYEEFTDEGWKTVVEDVKGYRGSTAYSVFTIKRKLMLHVHGVQVREV